MTVSLLAPRQLRERYLTLRATGALGPAIHLYAMQRSALACAGAMTGENQLVAFTISAVIERIARSQDDEEIVDQGLAGRLLAQLDDALSSCFAVLCEDAGAEAASIAAARLVDAYFVACPQTGE